MDTLLVLTSQKENKKHKNVENKVYQTIYHFKRDTCTFESMTPNTEKYHDQIIGVSENANFVI